MTFQESIDTFCVEKGYKDQSWYGKIAFVERQWGMFCAWLREKNPVLVKIDVRGGVAYDTGNHPGVEVEINDMDV